MTTMTMQAQHRSDVSDPGRAGSLRLILISVISGLAVVGLLGLSYQGLMSWREYVAARQTTAANAAGNRLVAGIFEVLLERLATNNALQAADPAPDGVRQAIAARRAAAEAGFAAGLATTLDQEFPDRPALSAQVRSAMAQAEQFRQRADAALRLPKAQRDADLLKTYQPVMTDMVNASLKVWVSALHAASGADPAIARLATIKQIGWKLREISGLERALVSTAIANGGAIPPDAVQKIAGYRAQVAVLWSMLQDLTAGEGGDSEIRAALAQAKDRYFGSFEPLSDRMRKLSADGAAYPMSAADWVATTNPQIDSLLGVMHAAGKVSEEASARSQAAALNGLLITAFGIALSLLVTLFSFVVVVRKVTRPLDRICRTVRALSAGELATEVQDTARKDEIGSLARAIRMFKEVLIDDQRMRAEQEETRGRNEAERKRIMHELANQLDATVKMVVSQVSSAAMQMQGNSQTLSSMAERSREQATSVVAYTEQTSANVETVAASSEQMASSIGEINRQVNESATITRRAAEYAQTTNTTIQTLADQAKSIGEVVHLINSIASQTNLLALNATIEAARAGEAGKGFAVVAGEVKNLATQTAKATEEISAQITAMQQAAGGAVGAINEITTTIAEIDQIATTVAAAIEQQDAATREIARNVQRAAQGTEEIRHSIVSVQYSAEGTGKAAAEVLDAARELFRDSEKLSQEVDRFIREVRSA